MASRASIAKHPIHPMLIVFPIGLWIFSLTGDIVYAVTGDLAWNAVAYWTMLGGIVGALAAAVPGLIDLISMQRSRAKTIGIWHMSLNLVVVAIFIADFALRVTMGVPGPVVPFVLSIVGVAILMVSGWLGGELVYVEGMAVEPRAERRPEEEKPRLRKVA